eukprot:CAMPEP_0175873658 /NCGR_PEP_ID=MMETSP0107_2-20121207/38438_1 /TAXON_ID=195067 ORGANISM="Goniomonas pacifica, Strain CCMP1869" /NCGR_SAMPLE_ID=MMETSP0107_2 /ASSEMBLY_ACC=CAM_ASM_000203 /LENGTH=54 /DNA_ID=CAMNT_0017192423 /DNA_START=41 /DNA_END=202 /DNA_ORIENTATION=-
MSRGKTYCGGSILFKLQVHVGSAVNEQLDELCVAFLSRHVQCCRPPSALIDIGS